jgi:hypothetical protein
MSGTKKAQQQRQATEIKVTDFIAEQLAAANLGQPERPAETDEPTNFISPSIFKGNETANK